MCSPTWGQIFPPATLVVDAQVLQGAAVPVAIIVVRHNGASSEDRTANFPVRVPLGKATLCRVTVVVASVGDDSRILVTSEVQGEDSRGPDECVLEVDDNHPNAHNIIVAATR